jgi:hypothetical protein
MKGRSNTFDALTVEQRFEQKFEVCKETGCWNWTACINKGGYGKVAHKFKNITSHRASYDIYNGPIPKSMHVLHKCDNRKCVNPEHLFLGTNAENVADKMQKGRHNVIPKKMTRKRLEDMYTLRAAGATQKEIGEILGVADRNINIWMNPDNPARPWLRD